MLPKIDLPSEVRGITEFIKKTIKKSGFAALVIAVSGGVDSATSLALSVHALGPRYVFPLLIPYKNLNMQGEADARQAIRTLEISSSQVEVIDISAPVDALIRTLDLQPNSAADLIRIGNIMARVRMVMLFDRTKKHRGLVMGTENKSEHYLSYYTRFGDEASDIEPIRHLYKTQVYELARYLRVPESILTKAPTAGLWNGQTDEGQFGFSYRDADQILYGLYEAGLTESELTSRGLSPDMIRRVKEWVEKNRFKHELPLIYKPAVTKKPVSGSTQ